jgi:hypothetical protein
LGLQPHGTYIDNPFGFLNVIENAIIADTQLPYRWLRLPRRDEVYKYLPVPGDDQGFMNELSLDGMNDSDPIKR